MILILPNDKYYEKADDYGNYFARLNRLHKV